MRNESPAEREYRLEGVRQAMQRRRAELKRKGLCRECGQRPAKPNKSICPECRIKYNQYGRLRRQRRTAAIRKQIREVKTDFRLDEMMERVEVLVRLMRYR